MADRDNLVPHQSRDVRCFAESRIAHYVQIQKAGEPERFADAVASGFLDVAKQFGRGSQTQAGEQASARAKSRLALAGERLFFPE